MTGVRIFEIVVAAAFVAFGIRSFVVWIRRPLDSRSVRDQILYAAYLTGRIGLWFAIGGIFLISALTPGEGDVFVRRFDRFRWYFFVPLGMALLQFVAAFLLGRGSGHGDEHHEGTATRPPA